MIALRILLKVLVTGGTGFIGSHLIPKLLESKHDVWAMERYVAGRYAERKQYKTVFGDLRGEHHTIRKVVHLAAISPILFL